MHRGYKTTYPSFRFTVSSKLIANHSLLMFGDSLSQNALPISLDQLVIVTVHYVIMAVSVMT